MSPVLTAPPVEAPPAPPERPGFFTVAWATFLGYLWTVLLALPLALAAIYAGLPLVDATDSVARGMFYRYDVWSWAAEACVGLLAVGATSLMVGHQLRTRTGWEVPFGTTFAVLVLTGYAPILALTPLYGATGFISLALAAFFLRRRAAPSGAEPTTPLGQVPRRLRRPVAMAVALAVPVMLVYAVGYSATHPLRFDAVNTDARTYEREPGKVVRFPVTLRNQGPEATGLEVVGLEGNPAWQFERRVSDHRRYDPLTLLVLELRQGPTCAGPVARLDAVRMRYTVLGMRHEQRIPLVDGPSVRCR